MSKNPKPTQANCDHVAGYIGRADDPLVKLVNASGLADIASKSDDLQTKGFSVTVFPWCPVCGLRLLQGQHKAKKQANGFEVHFDR